MWKRPYKTRSSMGKVLSKAKYFQESVWSISYSLELGLCDKQLS